MVTAAQLETGHTPSRTRPELWENCTIPWVTLNDVGYLAKTEFIERTANLISEAGLAASSARVLPAGTVVLSRDAAIPRLRRALVAPCTTNVRGLPSEVVLDPADDPVPLRCAVNLDSVESVSVAVLVARLGRLADSRMRAVCGALRVAADCHD
jgi:mRNA interferase MazF